MRRFTVETISSPAFEQKAKTCRNESEQSADQMPTRQRWFELWA